MNQLSRELQLGKAGEHLVCSDLIKQGFNAFLADQGLPYDVIVDTNNKLYKVQVKTTEGPSQYQKSTLNRKDRYRYSVRRCKGGRGRVLDTDVDYFAFVALDINQIAYYPIGNMTSPTTGKVKQMMEFKSKQFIYPIPQKQIRGYREQGKYLEDYSRFDTVLNVASIVEPTSTNIYDN